MAQDSELNGNRQTRQGYLICLTGVVIWSTTAIFIRYLTTEFHLPALILSFWRDFFVFIALGISFVILRVRIERYKKGILLFFLLYGLVLAGFNLLWTYSVALNGAAVATVLVYCSAGFTAVLEWWLFKERLDWTKGLIILMSLTGCIFVSGAYEIRAWNVNSWGVVTGLLSGLGFALYSLFGKKSAKLSIPVWSNLFYSFGFAALYLLGVILFSSLLTGREVLADIFWLGNNTPAWFILVILAVGPTIGGYGLYTASLGYLPASVANIIATLEPVFTMILAFVLLGESFNLLQFIGSGLIISSVILLRVEKPASRRQISGVCINFSEDQGAGKAPVRI